MCLGKRTQFTMRVQEENSNMNRASSRFVLSGFAGLVSEVLPSNRASRIARRCRWEGLSPTLSGANGSRTSNPAIHRKKPWSCCEASRC
jgi:hypothetical protein